MKDHPSKSDQLRAMREARYADPPREEVVLVEPAKPEPDTAIVAPPPVVAGKIDESARATLARQIRQSTGMPALDASQMARRIMIESAEEQSGTVPKRAMYAPPGQCECCDRNRANALERVKRHRERRKGD